MVAGLGELAVGAVPVDRATQAVAERHLRLEAEVPAAPPTDPPPTTTPPPTDPPPTTPPPTTPPPSLPATPTVDTVVVIQAEAFQARQTAQGHQWWVVDAERASVGTYFDASGPAADFLQSLSTAGADTTTDINAPNGPSVDYAIDVPTAGRYDLDLRLSGRSGGRSVFVRVVVPVLRCDSSVCGPSATACTARSTSRVSPDLS